MYAVTGVTGQVGSAVAATLLNRGETLRAVVRDPAKAQSLAARGCEIAAAEMTDAGALAQAFSGAEGVFVLIPPIFDPSPGFPEAKDFIAALSEALTRARPGRVVCISTIGAQAKEPNLLSQLGLVEQGLGAIGLPVVFLRPGWYMENAAGDIASARDTGVIRSFLQPLDRAIEMVATADVGRVAAELLCGERSGARIVELAGPRPVAPNDLAGALSTILGRKVIAEIVPRPDFEPLFLSQGMRNPEPRARMIDGFNEGWIAFEGEPLRGEVELDAVLRELAARGA